MPYATEHLAYTFSGGLPGSEVWSITLRTAAATGTDAEALIAAGSAEAAFHTMWEASSSWSAFNPPTVSFLECTCRFISAAGLTVAQGTAPSGATTIGEASAQTAPNQTALVVTTETARPGRTGRGRFYMPFLSPQFAVGTDKVSSGVAAGLLTPTAAFLNTLSAITNGTPPNDFGPFHLAIQSQVNMAAPPNLNGIAIGDVVDTQRRRRNKVVEAYVTTGLT